MPTTVLITGASSGIGRCTAELMARRGLQVMATARDVSTLAGIAAFPNVMVARLDVTDETSVTAAIASTIDRFGRLDALISNAGYGVFGPLEGYTGADVERQFRTNVFGTITCVRHALPVMREAGGGTIVIVSSIGGRIAAPFASAYHASKFALEGLAESLQYEASLHNLGVKLVEPGHFKTDFLSRSLEMTPHPAYQRAFDNYMGWVRTEDAKASPPDAVAATILKMCEDRSARLRYPVGERVMRTLNRMLPDAMWRGLMAEGMVRRPRPSR